MTTTTKPHTVPEQTRKIHAQLLEVRDNMIELQEQTSLEEDGGHSMIKKYCGYCGRLLNEDTGWWCLGDNKVDEVFCTELCAEAYVSDAVKTVSKESDAERLMSSKRYRRTDA